MIPSSLNSPSETLERSTFAESHCPSRAKVSWGAILAGATTALALHVLFMMLGAGLGLAAYSPLTEEDPVANISIGALIVHSICAIAALCVGGWVAGRFTPVATRTTGWLHGFSVWCASTVGGVIMVAVGSGVILGSFSKIVGSGLEAVARPTAAVAGGGVDLAADAVKRSGETITSFVDEAVGTLPDDRPANVDIRAKREIGFAMARLFNHAREGDASASRAAAASALVNHGGISQPEAERLITEWTASYEQLQADLTSAKDAAARKAREVAEKSADIMATISLWAFVGFLLGALAATWGGQLGAKCATTCEETTNRSRI